MLLFVLLSVLLNHMPIATVASSDVYELVKGDDYMKRPQINRNNLYENQDIIHENLSHLYGPDNEHDFYAEYVEDAIIKAAKEKDKNTSSQNKELKHRTNSKPSREHRTKFSMPPELSRKVLEWLKKIIGTHGRDDSEEADRGSDELNPLIKFLMMKTNKKTLELEKSDTNGVYILKVPIGIDIVSNKDSKERRKRETNATEIEKANSTVAFNNTESEVKNSKDTNSTEAVEVNDKKEANNTKECTQPKNLRRFDTSKNNGEVETKAVIKNKLLSYIQSTLDDIQTKVDSVQSIKTKFTSHRSFYIGYLLANIDVMGRKVVKVRDYANDNSGEWSEQKLFSILDSLNDAEKFILKLLHYLRRYLS